MPENFALYSRKYLTLPEAEMRSLADDVAPDVGTTSRGLTFTYRWPDLVVIVSTFDPDGLTDHLNGFVGYVTQAIFGHEVPSRGRQLIHSIRKTTIGVGVEIQPSRDAQGRAEELLGRLCGGLHPLIFYMDAIFDWQFRLLLAPDMSYDSEASFE